MTEKLPQSLLECGCGRLGYALVLCQEHAPIPYELTPRGHREVGRMRQWDAIEGGLVKSEKARQLLLRGARAEGRKIERRVRRQGVGK